VNRLQVSTFADFINNAGSNDKPVILFGCGVLLELSIDTLAKHGIMPKCIVDNNFWLWGGCKCGLTIESPQRLIESLQNAIVLIVSKHIFAIEKQLIEMGIEEYYAFLLFTESIVCSEVANCFFTTIPLQEA